MTGMKSLVAALTAAAFALTATATHAVTPIYTDARYSFAERGADLVARMTLEEKAAQLATSNAPAIPRLGVQEYAYWSEAQHGISAFAGGDYHGDEAARVAPRVATSFPTSLSASLTWDPALVRRVGRAIGVEARGFVDPSLFGVGQNNLGPHPGGYGSLFYFAPTLNLARDPRWGRTDETFGEDPLLAGALGAAWVDGFQGRRRYLRAVATAKHFALYNVERDRHGASSDTDEATIRDVYTAQFRRVVERGRVGGLMSSYNAINGTPAVANALTLNALARRTWGFHGYTTSDCAAIGTTYRNRLGPTVTGHDWAPPGWTTDHGGDAAVWTNTATGERVSGAAGGQAYSLRAGTTLNCIGDNGVAGHPSFWDPLRPYYGVENGVARLREAIDAGILDEDVIDRGLARVFALRMRTGEFDARTRQPYTRIGRSVIESPGHRRLAERAAASALTLLKNTTPRGGRRPLLPVDRRTTGRIVVLGDLADKVYLGGYSGAPSERISLHAGIAAAAPAAQVIHDDGGSSTTATAEPTLRPETEAAIRSADLVVVMVGTDGRVMGEERDRPDLTLPGNYAGLVRKVAAVGNPRIALLVQSAGPVGLAGVERDVAAILFSAPNGQRQGAAAAAVLFGAQAPGGHLSFTWYRDAGQLPSMDDYDVTPRRTQGLGRTYRYFTRAPAYPFGHGLSYTRFRYSRARIDRRRVRAGGAVTVRSTVTNVGSRAGSTVAQVYARRGREQGVRLVGFRRTRVLRPGRAQRIAIRVPLATTLGRWHARTRRQVVGRGSWRLVLARSASDRVRTFRLNVRGRLPRSIARVTVEPEQLVLAPGETVDLRGENRWLQNLAPANLDSASADVVTVVRSDDTFARVAGRPVRFAVNRPRIARVDGRGRLTALRSGVVTVSATVGRRTGRAVLVVR